MGYREHVGGYRGRKTGHDILITIVIVLAVLAAVLIGITLLGSDSLMEKLAILSPQKSEVQQEQQPEQSVPELEPEPEPEPVPEPEPEPEPEVMTAVELTLEEAVSIAAPRRMEELGANSMILNMKADSGSLGWVSAQAMAEQVEANSSVESVNELLVALNEQGYHTIARFSCFRDELLGKNSENKECSILSNSGYRWQDFEKVNWVSPYSQQVQDYLIALMVELAQLGFEEILLEHCGYPPDGSGEMGWIRKGAAYDLEQLDVVIAQFLEKADAALQPYGTTLSIRTTPEILLQDGLKTGLTASVLDRWADRIWLPEGEGENAAEEILKQVQLKEIDTRLVTITKQLEEESSVPRGMFREEE